jgi:uncharacterized protein (UPF0333 family)
MKKLIVALAVVVVLLVAAYLTVGLIKKSTNDENCQYICQTIGHMKQFNSELSLEAVNKKLNEEIAGGMIAGSTNAAGKPCDSNGNEFVIKLSPKVVVEARACLLQPFGSKAAAP